MKKIILGIIILFSFFGSGNLAFASTNDCNILKSRLDLTTQTVKVEMDGRTIQDIVKDCLGDSALYMKDDAKTTEGLRDTIITWTQNIAMILAFLSVLGIVIGALFLAASGGNDERVNKGKNIIKWAILGFLGIVFASSIILLIVNIFYQL